MSKVYTMEDMKVMSDDEFIALMPDEYLDDPEAYLRRYGTTEYFRLVNIVACNSTCLIRLNDGSRLNYHNQSYHFEPLFSPSN